MMKTTAQKIALVQKSISLQKRIRKNVEESRVRLSGVDVIDLDRMLAKIDEIVELLEMRIDQIARRAARVEANGFANAN